VLRAAAPNLGESAASHRPRSGKSSPSLCGAERAGTVALAAAALRMNLVLYKTTVKYDLVLRHQALAHAKAAVVMQRRSELSGKACWINY
jgi:hypothetical protein